MVDKFFVEQTQKSRVKSLIVTEFFKTYFSIIRNSVCRDGKEIIYLDLFSGPGVYEDGSKSTPLMLLDIVQTNAYMQQQLNIVFNDKDSSRIKVLKEEVKKHPIYNRLQNNLTIINKKALEIDLSEYLKSSSPIFSFIDPFGYVDVTADHVWQLIKNIGSDCVLFFNSDRILQNLGKPEEKEHFEKMFGEYLSEAFDVQKSAMSQRYKCEQFLHIFSKNVYKQIQKENYKRYKFFSLPFCFKADDKNKTSHYIVLFTKSHKAVIEMKKVMSKQNNSKYLDMSFDSKENEMQAVFINRDEYVEESIIKLINTICEQHKDRIFNQIFTIAHLMEGLDNYNMTKEYQTFPYTFDEIKSAVEILDEKGVIEIIDNGKKTKKRITSDREFKIKNTILEIYNAK